MAGQPGWKGSVDSRVARDSARERLAGNPFYVLGLRPDCARAEVEREGQKLIGMLELELSNAMTYRSPLGVHPRTPELVRTAMAELRDPDRRLLHELWAGLEPSGIEVADDDEPSGDDRDPTALGEDLASFPALRLFGFGGWFGGGGGKRGRS